MTKRINQLSKVISKGVIEELYKKYFDTHIVKM